MKKVLYSALAVTCAIAGVAASKANSNRTNYYFKYIGSTLKPITAAQITNVANWTLTTTQNPSLCPGSNNPCLIVGTSKVTVTVGSVNHVRPTVKPTATLVTSPYYTATTDANFSAFSINRP